MKAYYSNLYVLCLTAHLHLTNANDFCTPPACFLPAEFWSLERVVSAPISWYSVIFLFLLDPVSSLFISVVFTKCLPSTSLIVIDASNPSFLTFPYLLFAYLTSSFNRLDNSLDSCILLFQKVMVWLNVQFTTIKYGFVWLGSAIVIVFLFCTRRYHILISDVFLENEPWNYPSLGY